MATKFTTADFRITTELCDDGETWLWTLLTPFNTTLADGYSPTEASALKSAKDRRRDEIERLNTPERDADLD
jgi:hypothetical protein